MQTSHVLAAIATLAVAYHFGKIIVRNGTKLRMAVTLFIAAIISLTGWVAVRTHFSNKYDHITDNIKAAYEAQDEKEASVYLQKARAEIESRNLVAGSTDCFYNGSPENVGNYYKKLVAADEAVAALVRGESNKTEHVYINKWLLDFFLGDDNTQADRRHLVINGEFTSTGIKQSQSLKPWSDAMVRSGIMTKTLNEQIKVATPEGISVYPHNKKFFLWGWGSLVAVFVTGVWTLFTGFNTPSKTEETCVFCHGAGVVPRSHS